MPGGVNAWRFKLAEEEDKRRRKFGWDDLFDLLNTAAGGYAAFQGMKQAGARQDLAQEQFDYRTEQDKLDAQRQAGIDRLAAEKHDVGMQDAGYFRPEPATQGPMPADTQTVGDWTKMPGYGESHDFRQGLDQAQQASEAARARGGAPGQVFGGDKWHYPPDYGQTAGGDLGPSEPDIDRFMGRAEDAADRYMMQQAYAGGEGFLDPMSNNAPNRGHPEWQRVYNETLQSYAGGGQDIEEEPMPDLMANLRELAQNVVAGDQENIAELAALRQVEPGVAAVVDAMVAEIQAAVGGSAGGRVGGLFGMLGQGMSLAERAADLPSRLQAAPGAIGERVEGISESAWPLETLFNLLR